VLLLASAVLCLITICREWLQLRRAGKKWQIGWRPLGGVAFLFAAVWVVLVVLSLVDIQSDHNLYASLTIFDHSMRVSWIESVLRTGVPPANWLYIYRHPAPMRYYYFWYVVCAAIAQMWHLSARAVLIASSVWAGFSVAALAGLYIKHFLVAGVRTRQRFLYAIGLLMVTGLGVCVNLWNFFHLRGLPGYLEVWKAGQITSWFNSLFWVPHHVASMVCCMLGFLLVWMAPRKDASQHKAIIVLMAAAFASAFGLSIYVAFAFFLVMLAWGAWQGAFEHTLRPGLLLAAGGAGATILLLPYLRELTHTASNVEGSRSVFAFAVREMIPPDGLLASSPFQHLAGNHPFAAANLANLLLLVPGYAVELGFYLAVFLIYIVPAWRGRKPLTPAQRSLIFISAVTLVLISFVRSSVIESNDFGWRGALLLQFSLALLASELLTNWNLVQRRQKSSAECDAEPNSTPRFVQAIASYAMIIGAMTTIYQALMVRFTLPLHEMQLRAVHDPQAGNLPHKAYISAVGYAQLDATIPHDAVVQYNPSMPDPFWLNADWLGVGHQSGIAFDQVACGSEFGGDPTGCPAIAAAVDTLYRGASAEEARATCHSYGIEYLVSRIYDPAWYDKGGWVWALRPVVSDDEFRALDCRQ
jgi:hypothetical protein